MSSMKYLHVEGLSWDTSMKDLITCFQYSKAILMKITRPLDPKNLSVLLEFDNEKWYSQLDEHLSNGECLLKGVPLKKVEDKIIFDDSLMIEFSEFIEQKRNGGTAVPKSIKSEPEEEENKAPSENAEYTVVDETGILSEKPLPPNGNFQSDDIRRFCRVCNIELTNISNYTTHRAGKKHDKKQACFDRTGRYSADVELAMAAGRTVWQLHIKNRVVVKQVQTLPTVKPSELMRSALMKTCDLCNIDFTSPIVCLTHYEGSKHRKNADNSKDMEEYNQRVKSLVAELRLRKRPGGTHGGFNETVKRQKVEEKVKNDYQSRIEAKKVYDEAERIRKLPPRQATGVVNDGRRLQNRAFSRIFNEPNPTEANDNDEILEGEIIEEGEEEEVGGHFHERLKSLYKPNERL